MLYLPSTMAGRRLPAIQGAALVKNVDDHLGSDRPDAGLQGAGVRESDDNHFGDGGCTRTISWRRPRLNVAR
jgi:hypothetical protein